jgi:hypothetical protein
MFKIPLGLTKHLVSISFKVILWENGIFSDFFYVIFKYENLPVYGAVLVYFGRLGGLCDSQATSRSAPEGRG